LHILLICKCGVRSYIYEGATNGSTNIASPADRIARTHQPQKEILSVLDYRCSPVPFPVKPALPRIEDKSGSATAQAASATC
jgi:hypothetical protein